MPQRRLNAKSNVHATIQTLLQAVVALASVLSRNRSKADMLEGAMSLIEEATVRGCRGVGGDHGVAPATRGIPGGVRGSGTSSRRADIQDARDTRHGCRSACIFCRLMTRDPCSLSSSTVVTILGLAVEEVLLSSAATELALDPKHVDKVVHAVAQRD